MSEECVERDALILYLLIPTGENAKQPKRTVLQEDDITMLAYGGGCKRG